MRNAEHGYLVFTFKDRRRYRRERTAESLPTAVAAFEQSFDAHLEAAAYAAATGSYGQIVEAALPAQQVLPPVEAAQHACKEGT